ncbi:hypothetical protein GUJ93_ZPchr0115g2731 [Zizania palustris]|uniref:Uncharacterized protein n=1 Tax=Zizania palustris TaxID=103762 RepID=A0A8J5RCL4_ZIZPA|nr:hypothetical protein GUJ93_ZPchr0115g2731 [Zizania palustris]
MVLLQDDESTGERKIFGTESVTIEMFRQISHGISSYKYLKYEREERGISQLGHHHADDLPRMHGKDSTSKTNRREADQVHDREWEEEKRPRAETKRKHRK